MTAPDIRVIRDPDSLRLIADPLRLRILELLRAGPKTVTELAEQLATNRTRLYYHVGLLEEHGFVTVDETRVVSGITEKRYRLTAYRLSVDKALLGQGGNRGTTLESYLSLLFDEISGAIIDAAASGLIDVDLTATDEIGPRNLTIGRRWLRLDEAELAAFRERFAALQEEFLPQSFDWEASTFPEPRPGDQVYEWIVGFYPVRPPEDWGHE